MTADVVIAKQHLFLGAPILVAMMVGLVRLTKPERFADAAREHARNVEGHQMEPSKGLPGKFTDRFRSAEAWHRVGRSYRMEWGMVGRDLLIGFAVAGAVAALVPAVFFQAIFSTGWPTWLELLVQALMAPVLAVLIFIGSMGTARSPPSWPATASCSGRSWRSCTPTSSSRPHCASTPAYYGWRFAGYLALVFAASAVLASIIVHLLFGLVGLLPKQAKPATEMANFAIDYTFWLSLQWRRPLRRMADR
jgi:hypothetical protein